MELAAIAIAARVDLDAMALEFSVAKLAFVMAAGRPLDHALALRGAVCARTRPMNRFIRLRIIVPDLASGALIDDPSRLTGMRGERKRRDQNRREGRGNYVLELPKIHGFLRFGTSAKAELQHDIIDGSLR
jgi:hypothetical protein